MADWAVIINGMPGSGKTTLARPLGETLGLPVVSKDAVKEALADAVPGLPTQRLGAIASDAMWSLAGLIEGPVIVESFWASGRDDRYFDLGRAAAGIRNGVELWCEAPEATVRERFLTRPRHHAHADAGRLEEWTGFLRTARPISGFPVLRVPTEREVDIPRLAERIIAALRDHASGERP